MLYVLGAIIGLLLVVLWLLYKLVYLINEIKKYQYINNLKLLGFIKKTVESLKFKVERYKNDNNNR